MYLPIEFAGIPIDGSEASQLSNRLKFVHLLYTSIFSYYLQSHAPKWCSWMLTWDTGKAWMASGYKSVFVTVPSGELALARYLAGKNRDFRVWTIVGLTRLLSLSQMRKTLALWGDRCQNVWDLFDGIFLLIIKTVDSQKGIDWSCLVFLVVLYEAGLTWGRKWNALLFLEYLKEGQILCFKIDTDDVGLVGFLLYDIINTC